MVPPQIGVLGLIRLHFNSVFTKIRPRKEIKCLKKVYSNWNNNNKAWILNIWQEFNICFTSGWKSPWANTDVCFSDSPRAGESGWDGLLFPSPRAFPGSSMFSYLSTPNILINNLVQECTRWEMTVHLWSTTEVCQNYQKDAWCCLPWQHKRQSVSPQPGSPLSHCH